MSIIKTGNATYQPLGIKGKGSVSTESGALVNYPYGFNTRFENSGQKGSNPEELIAAAHSSCFTMALSIALEKAGFSEGKLLTQAAVYLDKVDGGYSISKSALILQADVKGMEKSEFIKIAEDAKENCPVSKLLNAEITLTVNFTGDCL
jgi:osmotically inducible protein OsmC